MSKYKDTNGNSINVGDTLKMEIKGLGSGEVDVIDFHGEVSIYDDHQGAYSLQKAIDRDDIILTKK